MFSKLLWLLIKVTKVTTEHQKWPKLNQNSIFSTFFCLKGKQSESQSFPQELGVALRSGPYLLVILTFRNNINF